MPGQGTKILHAIWAQPPAKSQNYITSSFKAIAIKFLDDSLEVSLHIDGSYEQDLEVVSL